MGQKLTDGKISAECRERLRTIHDTQDILGGKWKVMIIASLAAFGKKRFMELQRVIDGVGSKMLSRELQELEVNGLVSRTVMATNPVTRVPLTFQSASGGYAAEHSGPSANAAYRLNNWAYSGAFRQDIAPSAYPG